MKKTLATLFAGAMLLTFGLVTKEAKACDLCENSVADAWCHRGVTGLSTCTTLFEEDYDRDCNRWDSSNECEGTNPF